EVEEQDKAYIEAAVTEAKRRNPAISSSVFDFLQNTLLLQYPEDMSDNGKKEQRVFVMRFQQFTGPVMAKGVEDTAFYIYNPLVSLNEVGGNPRRFGTSVDEFHRQNKQRQTNFPHSMVSTSTHDSKRSEDVRARINVLSEIPREWRAALARWSRMNRGKKTVTAGITIPDKNEEYLIYQTLLGTFPVRPLDEKLRTDYCKRIQDYMLKAIREAKVNSSWMSPDNHYEAAVMNFVSGILKPLPSNAFFNDFGAFNRQIARWGMYNSLSQTLLKVFSPGVPDLYQGNEIWNYCLVDPDNRGQVDFTGRKRLLSSLKKKIAGSHREELARSLVKKMEDGMIKLYVASEALKYRRENAGLFNEGSYMPLKGIGSVGEQICAFMWQKENKRFLVCVPRLVAGLTRLGSLPPLGSQIWGDSMLILPDDCRGQQFHNIFTGENIKAGDNEATTGLPLSLVLNVFPVAALEFLQH
ncbi:MAG: malto-oligosyltrehalose synthase, partial [Dehalococcoidia bacterium]|nr:malto-oligosyltrehalose synthase [Dehalococcoidia bacterium]